MLKHSRGLLFLLELESQYLTVGSTLFFVLQESKKDEESMKTWPYFLAMDRILSCEGEMATK